MRASLALALLVTVGSAYSQEPAPSAGKGDEKPKVQAKQSKQRPTTEQRGTEQSPRVVKTLTGPKTKEATNQEAKEREDKSPNDWWITGATLWLAGVTTALAIFTAFLWGATAKLVRDAKETASAARAQERAYIFIHEITITKIFTKLTGDIEVVSSRIFGLDALAESKISFSLKNYGRTPAILKEVKAEAIILRDLPGSADDLKGTKYPVGFVLSSGETSENFECDIIGANDLWMNQVREGTADVYIHGSVRYADVFGEEWITGFCWEYGGNCTSFGLSQSEQLNYRPKQYHHNGLKS